MNDNKPIVITHLDLSHPKEEVFKIAKRSRLLINSICGYSKDLRKKGMKVHERYVNIIRTDIGYFCAFYEEDVLNNRTEEKHEKIEEQFEGLDGRMKVMLHDNEGNPIIKDVAEMIAMAYIPNPNNYEYVKHKNNNIKDNRTANLYWSPTK